MRSPQCQIWWGWTCEKRKGGVLGRAADPERECWIPIVSPRIYHLPGVTRITLRPLLSRERGWVISAFYRSIKRGPNKNPGRPADLAKAGGRGGDGEGNEKKEKCVREITFERVCLPGT